MDASMEHSPSYLKSFPEPPSRNKRSAKRKKVPALAAMSRDKASAENFMFANDKLHETGFNETVLFFFSAAGTSSFFTNFSLFSKKYFLQYILNIFLNTVCGY